MTLVSVKGALETVRRVVDNINEEDLSALRKDYIKFVSLCISFSPLTFEREKYSSTAAWQLGHR